jgi:hypothetical protein
VSRQIGFLGRWVAASPSRRKTAWALAIYTAASAVYALFAPSSLFDEHTPYNHYAHLAQAWLDGRLDLADGAPAYAHNNDFAVFEGRTYIVFPPFPAIILLPFVALAGSPEGLADGAVFLWLAGLGPALLFLALERLREVGASARNPIQNVFLALCFAFGTVFFFTAEQGTVWFAAHVVSVSLAALYLLASIEGRYPLLAGIVLALALSTRPPLAFAAPLFVLEALRCSARRGFGDTQGPLASRFAEFAGGVEWARLIRTVGLFAVPVAAAVAIGWWHNAARFDDPFEPGYRFLTVAWQKRMNDWGLFHYHYLARNLGVLLTSLPWLEPDVPFRINMHGLALWFTTPLYFWLIWPKQKPAVHFGLWVAVGLVALPTLFYQNSGWAQFGYRFSNDYAVFLFALLAVGMRPLRALFLLAAAWSMLVNGFGAATFARGGYERYYYGKGGQKVLYQPD